MIIFLCVCITSRTAVPGLGAGSAERSKRHPAYCGSVLQATDAHIVAGRLPSTVHTRRQKYNYVTTVHDCQSKKTRHRRGKRGQGTRGFIAQCKLTSRRIQTMRFSVIQSRATRPRPPRSVCCVDSNTATSSRTLALRKVYDAS